MAQDWEDIGPVAGRDGWEDITPNNDEKLKKQNSKLLGGLEAAIHTASSLASAVPTGIRMLGELAATGDLGEAMSRAESTHEFSTYEPRTKLGKEYGKDVNDLLSSYQQEVANKYSGDTEYLMKLKEAKGKQLTPGDYAAMNRERMVGDIIGNLYVPGVGFVRGKPIS